MKIFISSSAKDTALAKIISKSLIDNGYSVFVWNDNVLFQSSEPIIKQLPVMIDEADVIIALISDNYLSSTWTQAELNMSLFGSKRKRVIPIVIGNIKVPSFLSSILYIQIDEINDVSMPRILLALKSIERNDTESLEKNISENKANNEKIFIDDIKQALNEGNISLILGAGVSVDAGIPDWSTLLLNMLNKSLQKSFKKGALKAFPTSNLILGKYLKILFGDDFESTLRSSLYHSEKNMASAPLVDSLVTLIAPRRNKGSVESVITFNFDSVLEDTLLKHKIPCKAIYDEGMTFESTEIPIYHVHGYLPKNDEAISSSIVFSEDAYHTQFLDPFNWSNLIQLYKYMNNICLFIGLSLHDPNLRRLLDISVRKNTRKKLKHYIIKRRRKCTSELDEILLSLEEQDANALGLNVIWVDEYFEIPDKLCLLI